MKKTKIIYRVTTYLFAAFMLLSAIPDIMMSEDAIMYMTKLGYPRYFIPFIGVAKTLGVIAILIPGFPRIKEWAYAGLIFDLIGAAYSTLSIGESIIGISPILAGMVVGMTSYLYYHKQISSANTSETIIA
jgi:hypothetical protein